MGAGPVEVLAAVLDHDHPSAVELRVVAALAVATALLGDREVVADAAAVEPGEVLLTGGEPGGVGAGDQQSCVADGLPWLDQPVAAGERVEVVVLHGVEAPRLAPLRPGADDAGQAQPLLRRPYVEQPLTPRGVDDAMPVATQDQPRVPAPERLLLGLGLEAVDVADVVVAGERPRGAVALHDPDPRRDGRIAAELVVGIRAHGQVHPAARRGRRHRRGRPHGQQERQQHDEAT